MAAQKLASGLIVSEAGKRVSAVACELADSRALWPLGAFRCGWA
jgi:hypothetical protein